MSERSYDGPPVDASEQWISERPAAEYATPAEPNGEETIEKWPSKATPRDELNESQRAVITLAADPMREFDSTRELSRKATPDKVETYAHTVLRDHWPEGLDRIVQTDEFKPTANELEEIRRRYLNGESQAEISESYPRAEKTIGKYIRGDRFEEVSDACSIPPVKGGELPEGWEWDGEEARRVGESFDMVENVASELGEAKQTSGRFSPDERKHARYESTEGPTVSEDTTTANKTGRLAAFCAATAAVFIAIWRFLR